MLEVAADLVESSFVIAAAVTNVGDARSGIVITCDGEPDEAQTEFARESLRPVRNGHLGRRRRRLAFDLRRDVGRAAAFDPRPAGGAAQSRSPGPGNLCRSRRTAASA
jgi:hypothetical protein